MTIPIRLLILILSAQIVVACNQSPQQQKQTALESQNSPDTIAPGLSIDLRKLLANRSLPMDSIMTVQYDQYFKTKKQFVGFNLQTLIQEVLAGSSFDTTGAIVVFECTDGYAPTMELSKVLGPKKGMIVIRDLSASKGKKWLDSLTTKFEPFYLAWTDIPKGDDSYVLPYGLHSIRILTGAAQFKDAFPFDAPEMQKGFTLFQHNCMKCHAVNKVGGSMGPEFNIPKNITEYWKDADIIAFALNPGSFRYNAKMPAVTLSETDLVEIIRYLKYISGHKI